MAQLSYVVLIIAMNVLMCVLAEEFYPERYDHLDVRAILENKELRNEYYSCFMEIAPCKAEQKEASEIFSEAYQTKCKKCTPKQIENMNILTDWYVKNDPEKWQQIIEKAIGVKKNI